MTKCHACNGRILLGGVKYAGWTLCNQACVSALKVALVDNLMPKSEIEETTQQLYQGPCPRCKGPGPVDAFGSDTVTGMLVAYRTEHATTLSCVRCARRVRLQAAIHCLFLGWWGTHAALHTLVYIPKNLLAAVLCRTPAGPSKALSHAVKLRIAEANIGHFRKAIAAAEASSAAKSASSGASAKLMGAGDSELAKIDDDANPYRQQR